jgi:hypothetical protein
MTELPASRVTRTMRKLQNNRNSLVVEYFDDPITGEQRRRVIRSHRFSDEQKALFLEKFETDGRVMDACRYANCTRAMVNIAIDDDLEFAVLYADALEAYRDKLMEHHQNLIFNGETVTRYNKDGDVVEERQIYPIRLIELELKANFQQYRDSRTVDMKISGGVLIAPASSGSIEDWEKDHGNEIIDVTPEPKP